MKYRTPQQRNQRLTRILFIGMLALGVVIFLFSFLANLWISSLETMGFWLTALGIGFILWGGIGTYYTRYHYVGNTSVSRFANSGMEIIMIAGICIIGLCLILVGFFGFINWLRNV